MCIFCDIINDKLPSYKVYEDEKFLAFLSYPQAVYGHILLIPKQHYSSFKETSNEHLSEIFPLAKKIIKHLEEKLNVSNYNILTNCGKDAGQTIEHFHLHLLPRVEDDTLTIKLSSISLSKSQYEHLYQLLKMNQTKQLI